MAPRGSMACSLQLAVLMSAAIALGFGVRAGGAAQLCSEYYDRTCPDVHRVVRRVLKKAHEADVRIYASLTRLHFHDCFVQVKKQPVPCSADGRDAARLHVLSLRLCVFISSSGLRRVHPAGQQLEHRVGEVRDAQQQLGARVPRGRRRQGGAGGGLPWRRLLR